MKLFSELYRPKSPDEQKFMDKHVVVVHPDRNGNGDDVFKASKIKAIERKKERHGYNPGEDEKVYEEVEELEELSRDLLGSYSRKTKADAEDGVGKDRSASRFLAGKKRWGGTGGIPAAKVPATNEDVESLDEEKEVPLSKRSNYNISHYRVLNNGRDVSRHETFDDANDFAKKHRSNLKKNGYKSHEVTIHAYVKEDVEELDEISKATANDYRYKASQDTSDKAAKRKKSRDLAFHKITGRAKVQACEDVEQIEELSTDTLRSYAKKASNDRTKSLGNEKKYDKRTKGVSTAVSKLAKEDVESLEEKLGASASIEDYIHDFVHSDDPKFSGKSKQERIKMAQGAYYSMHKEDVEQIDELSKKTLGSYIKKASHEVATNSAATARYTERANRDKEDFRNSGYKDVDKWRRAKKSNDVADRAFDKSWSRRKGIAKATDKLTKEDIVNKALDKYLPETTEFSLEDSFMNKISDLSESYQDLLVDLFNKLDEENRLEFHSQLDEHMNELIAYALENRD